MNTLALRPLRWQLGSTMTLAPLCALGTGIGLAFQPTNRVAQRLQLSPPAPHIAQPLPDSAKAFQISGGTKSSRNRHRLKDRDLPSLENQIKQPSQLAQRTDIPEVKKLNALRSKPPKWGDLGLDRQRPQE